MERVCIKVLVSVKALKRAQGRGTKMVRVLGQTDLIEIKAKGQTEQRGQTDLIKVIEIQTQNQTRNGAKVGQDLTVMGETKVPGGTAKRAQNQSPENQ